MMRGRSAVRVLCAALLGCAAPPLAEGAFLGGAAAAELRVAVPALPASLDPQQARTPAEFAVAAALFTGLVTYDADGDLVPGAAESWQISADGLVYTFRLRGDLAWSDGADVTAEDFAAALRRALDPATAAPFAGRLNAIAVTEGKPGVEVTGRRALRITLARPSASFLGVLAEPVAMPRHAAGLGNGPYVAAAAASELVLRKNSYHAAARTHRIDRAVIVASDDPAAADLAWGFPPSPPEQLKDRGAGDGEAPYALIVNHGRAPFDKREVRHALAMVVDRDALVHETRAALGLSGLVPAFNIVPPRLAGYEPHQAPYMRIDGEGRAAIAAALTVDVAGGEKPLVPGVLAVPAAAPHPMIAAKLAEGWRKLGFDIRVETHPWGAYLQALDAGAFDLAVAPWPGRAGDALSFLAPFAANAGPWNVARYREPAFDEHLAAADAAPDPAARLAALRAAEGVLIEDQIVIPLFFFVPAARINTGVRGWRPNARGWHPLSALSVP